MQDLNTPRCHQCPDEVPLYTNALISLGGEGVFGYGFNPQTFSAIIFTEFGCVKGSQYWSCEIVSSWPPRLWPLYRVGFLLETLLLLVGYGIHSQNSWLVTVMRFFPAHFVPPQ